MIYTDYHLHTTFSHDGISTMEEHIQNAIKLGLKEICFTEHYDIYDELKNNTLFEILTRYKELGGKIITIGSDAHKMEDVCSNFKKATDLLKEIGYKSYAVFENREPRLIDL